MHYIAVYVSKDRVKPGNVKENKKKENDEVCQPDRTGKCSRIPMKALLPSI